MAGARTCPGCGPPIPRGSPEEICPARLLHRAGSRLHARAVDPDEFASLFPGLRFEGLLGQGGAGAVYRARQLSLDRLVAVKLIPSEAIELDTGSARGRTAEDIDARFQREARALARLHHPHIV